MAQTGYTPISIYYSSTATNVPTAGNLVAGELAINTADGKLFYKDSSGVVQTIASKAGALGDVVGPASATDNALARFDATTGKLIQNSVGILSDAGALTGITDFTYTGTLTGGTGIVNLGSGQFYKDASGNVGIGVTPSYRLDVSAASCRANITSSTGTNAVLYTATNTGGYLGMGLDTSTGGIFGTAYAGFVYTSGAYPLILGTSATERMRITSSGQLLVGTTDSGVSTSTGFRVFSSGQVSSTLAGSTAATDTYEVYSTGAAAYRFYVNMAGTINATSIVITAISDERLKENIKDIDTGLNSIMALKPRRFDWKEGKGQDKKNVAGFIAQEFETVFPECVGTSKAGEDGIEYKNINHETLIPTLVKAIQELKTEIDALKAAK